MNREIIDFFEGAEEWEKKMWIQNASVSELREALESVREYQVELENMLIDEKMEESDLSDARQIIESLKNG